MNGKPQVSLSLNPGYAGHACFLKQLLNPDRSPNNDSRIMKLVNSSSYQATYFKGGIKMKMHTVALLATTNLFLIGCAAPPQKNVDLAANTFLSKNERVGVAMTKLPKVDMQILGAGCLLCIAAASIANASLTAHSQTLPYEDLPDLKKELADALHRKGIGASVIAESLDIDALPDFKDAGENVARKDFRSLRSKYDFDKLVVLNISALGMERPYSSYIPTGDPKAVLRGTGYMVNLKTNAYEWYVPVNVVKSSDGNWDEPPKFPGLTNAYFQALEIGKDSFLKPFRQ